MKSNEDIVLKQPDFKNDKKQYSTRSVLKNTEREINKKRYYSDLIKKHNIKECRVIITKYIDRLI